MSLGSIAALIAAIALVALVAFMAIPLLKLGRVLEETRLVVRDFGHNLVPIMVEARGTVTGANEELAKLSLVTEDMAKVSAHAAVVTEQAAQMSQLFSVTIGGPLVRTAAFTYGVRKAFRGKGAKSTKPVRRSK